MKSLVFKNQNLNTNQVHKEKIKIGKITIKNELVFEKVCGLPFKVPLNPSSLRRSQTVKLIVMVKAIPQYHFSHFFIRILLIINYVLCYTIF